MNTTIKRSMSVKPSPIVRKNNYVTYPSDEDWEENRRRHGPGVGWKGEWGYKITRVTNNTDFRPGLPLDKATADNLIKNGWTVTVL